MKAASGAGRLVAALTTGPDRDGEHAFATMRAAALEFGPFGIPGELHGSILRVIGGVRPWKGYSRGTPLPDGRGAG